jgi:L-fucose dehydrogenase
MDLELKNAVIVVSGGGAGIGQAISRACLAEGSRVVILSRASQNVMSFVDEMASTGQPCELIETHLADMGQCKRAIDYVTANYGRMDGLVNNAGVNDRIGLESGNPDRFMESIRQNLLHYYALAHYALPMLKDSHGSILNISSKVALTGQGGTSAYAAAKGAQLALTREWAAELLPFGIRVNAILPADVMTPLYKSWLGSLPEPERKLEQIKSRIPFGQRMTESSEIGAAAVFLLSAKQSGHTTAQHFVVDGGYTHLDRALT